MQKEAKMLQTLRILDTKETSTKTSVWKIKTHFSNYYKNKKTIPICRLVVPIRNEVLQAECMTVKYKANGYTSMTHTTHYVTNSQRLSHWYLKYL